MDARYAPRSWMSPKHSRRWSTKVPVSNTEDDGFSDLSDHDSFVNGMPHATFQRMRTSDPCAWSEYAGGKGFWSITRHADILTLNREFKTLSSAQGIRIEDQTHEEYMARRTFQETDPPEHTRVRALLAKAFSKKVIGEFTPRIEGLVDDILDDAFERSEFDAVKSIARELPMRMLGQIIGVPDEDLPWLVEKGDELIANADPDYTAHVIDQVDTDQYRMMPFRSPAGADLYNYAQDVIERQRAEGNTDSVLHMLTQPDARGTQMSDIEFRNFFCLLVAAGNDTTRYSIAAGLYALTENPQALAQMRAGGSIWDTAPDEIIRWASPTFHFRRTALTDVELHGKQIKAGDKVLLWFASGNRDTQAFDAPDVVDLARAKNKHVAFGQGGPHVCLGMWLARLEVTLLFRAFAKRVRQIERTDAPVFLRSNFVGGIKRLPVRVQLM
jgi:cytochrome P450